jgi:hypothetical protein
LGDTSTGGCSGTEVSDLLVKEEEEDVVPTILILLWSKVERGVVKSKSQDVIREIGWRTSLRFFTMEIDSDRTVIAESVKYRTSEIVDVREN